MHGRVLTHDSLRIQLMGVEDLGLSRRRRAHTHTNTPTSFALATTVVFKIGLPGLTFSLVLPSNIAVAILHFCYSDVTSNIQKGTLRGC